VILHRYPNVESVGYRPVSVEFVVNHGLLCRSARICGGAQTFRFCLVDGLLLIRIIGLLFKEFP